MAIYNKSFMCALCPFIIFLYYSIHNSDKAASYSLLLAAKFVGQKHTDNTIWFECHTSKFLHQRKTQDLFYKRLHLSKIPLDNEFVKNE